MEIKLTNVLFLKRKNIQTFIMRTFIFLFCTTVFSFSSGNILSQNTKIVIDTDKTITVDQVFEIIKQQTDYNFIYRSDMFKDFPKVYLKKGIIRANKLLKISLRGGDFNFSFNANNNIIIIEAPSSIKQQEFTIKGVVSDESGMPLIGVTVLININQKGVYTDVDGKYSIPVSKGDKITFSYIGFISQEFTIVDQKELNVILKQSTGLLEEVVLVGYGTQKRSEVSSSISSIKAEAITKNAIGNTSFDRALEGLSTGVRITSISGEPGAGVDINIRGIISPFAGGNNNPLFVIDGVPFHTAPPATFRDATAGAIPPNPLLALNPDDIESIDVLKDAAATAIYGSRGANGVIIVKTKRGKKNKKIQVSLGLTSTFATPIGTIDYLDTAADYKIWQDELLRNSIEFTNVNSNYFLDVNDVAYTANFTVDSMTGIVTYNGLNESYFGNANTNWADEVFRDPAFTQKYNVTVDGGSENTSYLFGGSFSDQEGLIREEKYKQYNFKAAIDSKINKTFNMGTSINFGFLDTDSGTSPALNRSLNSSFGARPDFAARDENGNINRLPSMFNFVPTMDASPLAENTLGSFDNKTKTLLGNIYVEANLLKNLKVRYDFNASQFSAVNYRFIPTLTQSIRAGFVNQRFAIFNDVQNSNVISNLTANYNTTINKHSIGVLAGLAYDRSTSTRLYILATGFPDDLILTNLSSASNTEVARSTVDTGLNSMFGRISYSYADKYFATINLRSDTSIKFGPNNRRAFFPSLAASWNIAKEKFLTESTVINNLRLRGSVGRTGSTNIGDFAYQQFFSSTGTYVGNSAVGLLGELPNEDIKWETTDEVNFGLDFGLFNNRLRGSVDIYNKKTTGALTGFVLPLETGATTFTANFADLTNKGFEIEIGGDLIKTKDFKWSANLMISQNRNTLDKFSEDGIDPNSLDFYEVGEPVGILRGYVVENIFQNQAEIDALNATAPDGFYQEPATGAGDFRYVDLNGDGEITLEDRKILGSTQEDYFGSFNTSFSYKGFELSALFTFSKGGESELFTDFFDNRGFEDYNTTRRYYNNRWTPTNTDAFYPRAILDDPNNNARNSDRFVYDTSYLRLKNLQLGYTLPNKIIEHLGLSQASLFISGSNLWTGTDFPGVDPASRGRGIASTGSVQNNDPYPIAKTWSLGINVKF